MKTLQFRYLSLCFFLFFSITTFSQTRFLSKTGEISFEASASTLEEVKAKSNSASAVLNSENSEFAALIFLRSFKFKKALMEEHFNENYVESDKFPNANFKGKLENFSLNELKTTSSFKLNGTFTFRGKTKKIESLPIKAVQIGEAIQVTGVIVLNISEFEIKIPRLVRDKISENVEIAFDFLLKN